MTPSVAVIGTGFGGLAAVIELKKRGFDDIVMFEKADDVGGVWRENTYPGAACDVPSPFYSYSFERNPRWPHRFSRQPAILDYMRHVADKYDVRRHIRFETEVTAASYDADAGKWTVELSNGRPGRGRRARVRGRPALAAGLSRHRRRGHVRRPHLPLRVVGPRRRPDAASGSR